MNKYIMNVTVRLENDRKWTYNFLFKNKIEAREARKRLLKNKWIRHRDPQGRKDWFFINSETIASSSLYKLDKINED